MTNSKQNVTMGKAKPGEANLQEGMGYVLGKTSLIITKEAGGIS